MLSCPAASWSSPKAVASIAGWQPFEPKRAGIATVTAARDAGGGGAQGPQITVVGAARAGDGGAAPPASGGAAVLQGRVCPLPVFKD